jgi:hypothetical protein
MTDTVTVALRALNLRRLLKGDDRHLAPEIGVLRPGVVQPVRRVAPIDIDLPLTPLTFRTSESLFAALLLFPWVM